MEGETPTKANCFLLALGAETRFKLPYSASLGHLDTILTYRPPGEMTLVAPTSVLRGLHYCELCHENRARPGQ